MTALAPDALAIGLGGNVGTEAEIRERFRRAREALGQLGPVRAARLYRTAPIGPMQPPFLNTAIAVRYPDGTPEELIATVLELERLLGRDRRGEVRWGPRTIDLDVLVWGPRVLDTPALVLPHPRLLERRFVLQPLIDLFGEAALVPGTSVTLGAAERRVTTQVLEERAATW